MEIRTVSVIGLGALGVLFGEHLAGKMEKGTLRIVADRARIEKYDKEKVYSNGKAVDFQYVTPEEETGPSDLVIFAVKYGGLKQAVEAVRNHVGPDTLVISTLNGISSEGVIGEAF
ncbi:MAG TPA: 2-dehydropantoate 2-reductase, partial [Clostridiaceae bacterium]|nr:2-dehydropantoate 2-reductase [Clostridiaceae bacterium]